jgi:hypothetical protein
MKEMGKRTRKERGMKERGLSTAAPKIVVHVKPEVSVFTLRPGRTDPLIAPIGGKVN